ncbi:MAG: oligosaccharide flippase family protein, partial [Chloroflexota bacterium]
MSAMKRDSPATGALLLASAQAAVSLCGYLIHFGLARILGPAAYGHFGVAYNALYIPILFTISGIPTAVSRFSSSSPQSAATIRSKSLRIQVGVSLT